MGEVAGMLNRLPTFPALDTLSFALNEETEELLNALPPAPMLTTLNFRLVFVGDDGDAHFRDTIDCLPWGWGDDASQSTPIALMQRFPLLHRIEFHFCVPRHSVIHFRCGLRKRMERELADRLQETAPDLTAIVQVRWLDDKLDPMVYSKTNGKPRWKVPPGSIEPDTEESDFETDPPDTDGESDSSD